jgi:glycerol-3-phosphate O-acyltransferase
MEGASQMFYIEGGRSRTGKMLSPKQGMLSMMLNVLRLGKVKDLYFVPMSVDYGKLFEGQSYIDELRGKDKQKESVFAILDTFKFFKKRQGITYMQFAEPFSVINFIKNQGYELSTLDDNTFSKIIDKLAEHVIYQINSVVTITPSAVISLTLLSNFRRGIQKSELMRITKLIFHYLKTKQVRLPSIEENFEKNFDNVLHTFEYNNYVQSITYLDDFIVKINENARPFLDYYKNNIIHLFLQMSFISLVIRNHDKDEISIDEIETKIEFFKKLFSYEFIYSDLAWNRQNLIETIKFLSLVKTVKMKDNVVSKIIDRSSWLTILGNLVLNFIESYFTVADYLMTNFAAQQEIESKHILAHGQNLYAIGIINMNESISKENYQNALKYIRRNNVLQSKESITMFRDSLFRYLL